MPLIVHWTGRAREVIDLIGLQVQGEADVMTDNLKIGVIQQMDNISLLSREKVVDAYDFIAFFKQTLTKMTA